MIDNIYLGPFMFAYSYGVPYMFRSCLDNSTLLFVFNFISQFRGTLYKVRDLESQYISYSPVLFDLICLFDF